MLSLSGHIINAHGGNKPLRRRTGELGSQNDQSVMRRKDDSLGVRASGWGWGVNLET